MKKYVFKFYFFLGFVITDAFLQHAIYKVKIVFYALFIILSCKAGLVYDFKALQCVLEVCAIFIQNTKKFRKCKQIGMIGKFNI
jgi:hypothetical protein